MKRLSWILLAILLLLAASSCKKQDPLDMVIDGSEYHQCIASLEAIQVDESMHAEIQTIMDWYAQKSFTEDRIGKLSEEYAKEHNIVSPLLVTEEDLQKKVMTELCTLLNGKTLRMLRDEYRAENPVPSL